MPRIIKEIPLSCLKVDYTPLNPKTLALVDFLRNGGSVPPIHTELLASGQHNVLQGRHRVVAYKLLGRTTIEAKFASSSIPQADGYSGD